MTERDKQTIAKIELAKVPGIITSIIYLSELNEALEFSLMGTGIDYSKERVQTSPVNSMEEVMSRVADNSKKIEQLKETLEKYRQRINRIEDRESIDILIDIYVKSKTFSKIAEERDLKHKSNVEYKYKKALTLYYNINCQ